MYTCSLHWQYIIPRGVLSPRISCECMYVCMCVCVYTYIPGREYVFLAFFGNKTFYNAFCPSNLIQMFTCIYIYICMYMYLCMYVCMYTHTYIYMYAYIYACIYIHTHIYMYAYTNTGVHAYVSLFGQNISQSLLFSHEHRMHVL